MHWRFLRRYMKSEIEDNYVHWYPGENVPIEKKKSLIVLVKGARENLPLAEKNSQMCQLLTYSTTKRTFGVRISEWTRDYICC